MVSGFIVLTTLLLRTIHGEFGVEFAYSALIGVLGSIFGLVIAVVTTPFTSEERTQWSNLTSAIVGAVAGYGISILDDSVNYVFKDANLLQNPVLGVRTALFLSCGAFALLYGFSYRRYYVRLDLDIDDDKDLKAQEDKVSRKPRRSPPKAGNDETPTDGV
jgi:hypothetical protein